METYVSKLKEIVNDSKKSIYLTNEEKDLFMKKSEEIDDYIWSMP